MPSWTQRPARSQDLSIDGSDSESDTEDFADVLLEQEVASGMPSGGFYGSSTHSQEGVHLVSIPRTRHAVPGYNHGASLQHEETSMEDDDVIDVEPAGRPRVPEDMEEGYNSDDERTLESITQRLNVHTVEELLAMEAKFEDTLKQERGLAVRRVQSDGNCLFRAVALLVFGDEELHANVRQTCMDWMVAERDHYSQFVTEDFNDYIKRKREDKCFGNNLEIQAMSEQYNRPVEVYSYSSEPINIFQGQPDPQTVPIRLSYHANNHYNAVYNPDKPGEGVGQGLGGAEEQRDLEEKLLMEDTLAESEKMALEEETAQAVLESSRAEMEAQEREEEQRAMLLSMGMNASSSDHMDADVDQVIAESKRERQEVEEDQERRALLMSMGVDVSSMSAKEVQRMVATLEEEDDGQGMSDMILDASSSSHGGPQLTPEQRAILESMGYKVEFMDASTLEAVLQSMGL